MDLATLILRLVTVWTMTDGTPVYVEHMREARGGPEARAAFLAEAFYDAAVAWDLDPVLLIALAKRESGMDAYARGSVEEFGVMQLHPRSKWGRRARNECRQYRDVGHPGCELAVIWYGAQALRDALDDCRGDEWASVGFYRAGRCIRGPGGSRVMALRIRMLTGDL